MRGDAGRPAAAGAARQGRAARLRRELRALRRAGQLLQPRHRAVLDDGTAAAGGRLPVPQRVPDLARPSARAAGWRTRPLQSGLWVDSQRRYDQLLGSRPPHALRGVPPGGLAHRVRCAREHPGLARGRGLLRVRPAVRLPRRRLPRPEVRLRHRCPTSTRCRAFRTPRAAPADRAAGDGRDRPGLQPPPLGAAAAPRPLGQVGDGSVFEGMPEQGDTAAEVFATPTGSARPTAVHRVHARHGRLLPDHLPRRRPRGA